MRSILTRQRGRVGMADHRHAESHTLGFLENGQRLIGYVKFQTAGIRLEKQRARFDLADLGIDHSVHKEWGAYFRLCPRTWRKGAAHRYDCPDPNRN